MEGLSMSDSVTSIVKTEQVYTYQEYKTTLQSPRVHHENRLTPKIVENRGSHSYVTEPFLKELEAKPKRPITIRDPTTPLLVTMKQEPVSTYQEDKSTLQTPHFNSFPADTLDSVPVTKQETNGLNTENVTSPSTKLHSRESTSYKPTMTICGNSEFPGAPRQKSDFGRESKRIKLEPRSSTDHDITDSHQLEKTGRKAQNLVVPVLLYANKHASDRTFGESMSTEIIVEVIDNDLEAMRRDGNLPFTGNDGTELSQAMFQSTTEVSRSTNIRCRCLFCDYISCDTDAFVEHWNNHAQEKKPYKCSVCSAGFASKCDRKEHTIKKHGILTHMYQCEFCKFTNQDKDVFRYHWHAHLDEERPYKCSVCDAGFASKIDRKIHTYNKTCVRKDKIGNDRKGMTTCASAGVYMISCSQCQYKTSSRTKFQEHMSCHHEQRLYSCSQCEYKSADMNDLIGHSECHKTDN